MGLRRGPSTFFFFDEVAFLGSIWVLLPSPGLIQPVRTTRMIIMGRTPLPRGLLILSLDFAGRRPFLQNSFLGNQSGFTLEICSQPREAIHMFPKILQNTLKSTRVSKKYIQKLKGQQLQQTFQGFSDRLDIKPLNVPTHLVNLQIQLQSLQLQLMLYQYEDL